MESVKEYDVHIKYLSSPVSFREFCEKGLWRGCKLDVRLKRRKKRRQLDRNVFILINKILKC